MLNASLASARDIAYEKQTRLFEKMPR